MQFKKFVSGKNIQIVIQKFLLIQTNIVIALSDVAIAISIVAIVLVVEFNKTLPVAILSFF